MIRPSKFTLKYINLESVIAINYSKLTPKNSSRRDLNSHKSPKINMFRTNSPISRPHKTI